MLKNIYGKTQTLITLCASLLLLAQAHAATITHQASGIQFDLPDQWLVLEESTDSLVVANPAQTVSMHFGVTSHSTAGAYLTGMGDELRKLVEVTQVTDEMNGMRVNGLQQSFAEGTGLRNGTQVEWGVTLVEGGAKALAVFAYGQISQHEDTVYSIYDSIKPISQMQAQTPQQMPSHSQSSSSSKPGMQTIEHESGVMIDFPASWRMGKDADVLAMTPPAEDVLMVLIVSRHTDIDSYLAALDQEIGNWIREPQVTWGPYTETVNGLQHKHVEGIGLYESKVVDWDLRMVQGDGRSMILLSIGDISRMQDTVTGIYQSVRVP